MNISLSQDIQPISYVKNNLKSVLDSIRKNKRPMIITQNGTSAGVLVSVEEWEKTQRELKVIKIILEGEKSLKEHGAIPFEDFEKEMRQKYDL